MELGTWSEVHSSNQLAKRHEHAYVALEDRFYLLGGRRIQPVQVFDPETQRWTNASPPPIELHHFQAVTHGDKIYVIGALTGKYPAETPVPHIYTYTPKTDSWSKGAEIPQDRRRGSAGAMVHDGKIYLACGIQDGHRSGWVPWLDSYDLETEEWTRLPDAPRARDHFQLAVCQDLLVAAGGRRSGFGGSTFAAVTKEVDVYDFAEKTWRTLPSPGGDIPTPRAGTASLTLGDEVVVFGGESASQDLAHAEVEAVNPTTGTWRVYPPLSKGRHASQAILHENKVYLASGSVTRGGTESESHEVLTLTATPRD